MRRLLNKYRWELWLLIGIPAVASLFVYIYEWSPVGRGDELRLYGWASVTAAAAAAILKTASYRWVRQLGRPMLTVFWRFSLSASAVGTVVFSIVNLFSPIPLTRDSNFSSIFIVILILAAVMSIMRLWFAREASRTGLAHAFLFVALTLATVSPIASLTAWITLREYIGFDLQVAMVVVGNAAFAVMLVVTMTLLAIWALTTFDSLDRSTRRRAIIALIALGAFGAYVFGSVSQIALYGYARAIDALIYLVLAALSTLFILGLTYLVRVRQPTEPPNGLPSPT